MQLILNTHGLSLTVSKGTFFVKAGEEKRQISPEQISSIGVTTPCMISSAAVELAVKADIPIYFFDEQGDAYACLRSPYFESIATLRRKQVYFSDQTEGAVWVVEQFGIKGQHQIEVLEQLIRKKPQQKKAFEDVIVRIQAGCAQLESRAAAPPSPEWSSGIMGWEGSLARQYWQALGSAMPAGWEFSTRNRRPALDPFNATINYYYGMLYALVEQALFAAGLDPHLGILHVDEYDRPTLAFDLIEPFRPWIDGLVVETIFAGQMDLSWYDTQDGGYRLNSAGKKGLIPRFNAFMQASVRWQARQMTRTAHIYRCAGELANRIESTVKRPV
ncbi:MAG: CRISPR-associated endonuclease Cas1 1 [Haliscomenobacter sp.]|jgi:CRISPR-associated protein Cas1|nr:CRISPR-associated endonuclease Cas1 1 [Haliscomenobacter sp.]